MRDTLIQDLRYALRTLRRTPGFTVAAVACLALGIGANTAIFSVINGVLLRPLPFANPDALVVVWEAVPRRGKDRNVVSPANYLDWRAQSSVFTDIGAYIDWRANLTGLDEPVEVATSIATASFFEVLGVPAALGRVYTEAEDVPNGPAVAVLSHRLWQRQFGGRADALGKSMNLNGRPVTVVGVMPEGFGMEGSKADVWTPMGLDPAIDYRTRTGRYLTGVARLKTGVSPARAQTEMDAIARRLETAHPSFNAGWGVTVVPMYEQVVGGVRRSLVVLGGVVAFVLLIACANVANLLLARSTGRSREIAVRSALGAGRRRVVQQLLTESVVLALLGGAVGLFLAYWALQAVRTLAPQGVPRLASIGMDGWTLVFTAAIALATGLVFGLVPALHAGRGDLQSVLREGSRGSTSVGRARGTLVVAQVALSLVLLVGAGLMIRSFAKLQSVDPGFDPDGVLTARLQLAGQRFRASSEATAFFTQLLERVERLPGVASVGAINWLPFAGLGSGTSYWIEGRPVPPPTEEFVADVRGVDTSYFRTMRIRVARGVPFDARVNSESPKQVVVNEAFVRAHFAGSNPIGEHVLMPWGDTLRGEIVGVVADTKHTGLDSLARPMIYWAMKQFPTNFMTLVVRSQCAAGAGAAACDPMRLVPAITREVRALDPNQPLADVKPLDAYLGQSVAQRRFSMTLLGIFSGVALLLAAVGIYGVLAYSVAQRTREIGVRMALGARDSTVAGMVVREALGVVGVGLAIGVAGALALTRVLASLLYEVSPTDPLTFVGVALVLGAVALAASYLPARRAARVDPIVALRQE
jgi:putative ABC transport system permease protein